jgi:hypothetical protein
METSEELNEEPAVVVRETSPALQLTPQDHQLMSARGILSLKANLRLERRGQHGQNKPDQRDHRANLADSVAPSTRIRFSVHRPGPKSISLKSRINPSPRSAKPKEKPARLKRRA